MFNLTDRTYHHIPREMPLEVMRVLLMRIADYVAFHNVPHFNLALHGGEPTLWPEAHFFALLDQVAELRARGIRLEISIQTNLLKLPSEGLLCALYNAGIRLGVSIDGPQMFNDSRRYDHARRGSYRRIIRNVEALSDRISPDAIGGFLCVADPAILPEHFFDWVLGLPLRKIDVLWPIEFNHFNPPWGASGETAYRERPRFGAWFSDLFHLWWRHDDPNVHIRMFDDAIRLLLGGAGHSDFFRNREVGMFAVNTDGRVEYPDYLRAGPSGAIETNISILNTSIDALHDDPIFRSLLQLDALLPQECCTCPHVDLCGGGFLPGRVTAAPSLISPRQSVLCFDQKLFFDTVRSLLEEELTKAVKVFQTDEEKNVAP